MSEILSVDANVQSSVRPIDWRFIRNCVIGTTLSVASMGGCGALIPNSESAEEVAAINTLEADINTTKLQIHNYENDTVIYEQHEPELEDLYGGSCVNALLPYSTQPLLKSTSTDQVVSDLLRHPKAPCGSEPTKVRTAAIDVDKTITNLDRLEEIDYDGLVIQLQEQQKQYESKNKNHGRLKGILVMGSLGVFTSAFVLVPQRYRIRKPVNGSYF